jgi:hypothetical protein
MVVKAEHRVARYILGIVQIAVIRRLVDDDPIFFCGGRRNSSNVVTVIDSLLAPWYADVFLDTLDDLPRGQDSVIWRAALKLIAGITKSVKSRSIFIDESPEKRRRGECLQ